MVDVSDFPFEKLKVVTELKRVVSLIDRLKKILDRLGFVAGPGATGALALPASLGVVGMVVALLVGADAG